MDQKKLHKLMKKLGFPRGLWLQDGEGLCARFDSRDRLIRMYWAHENAPMGQHLTLDPIQRCGKLHWPRGSGGSSDFEIYKNGEWELFDAWSDNTRPSAMPWSDWITKSVSSFAAKCRCVLCGDTLVQAPPATYNPSETQFLCKECYEWTQEGSPVTRSWPLGRRECTQCEQAFDDMEPMYEGRRGKLCTACSCLFRPTHR